MAGPGILAGYCPEEIAQWEKKVADLLDGRPPRHSPSAEA